ncbi:MAG TPA: hypothetical protein VKA46_03415 [Gemmataceae bacterium]|nr:hypothetical protein [Gemmataceae bacterium]
MVATTSDLSGGGERRATERHSCKPDAACQVTDVLDQRTAEASPWNVSRGGICVLVGPEYDRGTRLTIELRDRDQRRGLVTFGKVEYTLLLPSAHEMWLTGCSFQGEPVPAEELSHYA